MSNIRDLNGPPNLWLPPKEEPQKPATITWGDLEGKYSEIKWVFHGYIAEGHTTMIVGPPAMGKSYLMLSWVKTLMYGGTWPDGTDFVQPIEGAMILWVETEGGEPLNIPRAKKMGIDVSRICTIHDAKTEGNSVNLMDRKDLDSIISVAGFPKVVAIVVDSLSGGHNANENETGAGKIVQGITQIARKVNKPLLLAHHVNKQGFDTDTPSMMHVRGSGSQLQYPRIVVQLDSPDPQQPNVKRVTCTKNNLAQAPEPLGFEMTEAGPEWCDAPMPRQRERHDVNRVIRDTKVLEMVKAGVPYSQISRELGTSKANISGIVKRDRARNGSSDDADELGVMETPPHEPVDPVSGNHVVETPSLYNEAPS